MLDAQQALERLKQGNEAFVREDSHSPYLGGQLRRILASGQAPFAVIVGCSDSRIPVEMVFHQGLGDLFVVRVAGNVVHHTQLGSIEFGVDVLGAKLVVVMGHERCGAVDACLNMIATEEGANLSEHLNTIVDIIKPSAAKASGETDREIALNNAIKFNVEANVQRIIDNSEIMAKHVDSGKVKVIGAHYELSSGRVEFFD